MWFQFKRSVAPLYKDEMHRRIFATASGRARPKGADKLKKLKPKDPKEERGWRRWLSAWRH